MKKLFFLVATMCCTLMAQAELTSETLTCDGSTKTAESEHFLLEATAKDGVNASGWKFYSMNNDKITVTAKDGELKINKIKFNMDDRSNPVAEFVQSSVGTRQSYTWFSYYLWFTDIDASSVIFSISGQGCQVKSVEVYFENTPTAMDNVAQQTPVVKTMENGQVVILRDGVKYSAQGALIR